MNPPSLHPAVLGPYRLVRQLGFGGMGVVYLAEDSRLARKVAIKLLPRHLLANETVKKQFLNEARAAARLQHPNIVTIYDVGEIDGQSYYSMQYVEGRSVRELIDVCRRGFDEATRVFERICAAIAHAHQQGLVHRDIKPANVIVTPDGQPMVLDFGLATVTSDESDPSAGSVFGTPNYMSPEQVKAQPVDHRSDIFSLGVMLFEMITGVCPFARGYVPATAQAIVHDPTPLLSTFIDGIPDGWQAIIEKALVKDRSYRYQSVRELLMDIEQLRRGEQIEPSRIHVSETRLIRPDAIAVLYLRNLGPADDEYLSYGLTEDMIVDLTRFARLRVTPMRKILKYRDTVLPPETIARELGVGMIVDGSIRRSGETIRLSVQLLDIPSDTTRWAERFESSVETLAQTRQQLTEGIARAAKTVDAGEQTVSFSGPTSAINPIAYEYYLRGKYLWEHKADRADVETALGLFDRALATDPGLLLSHCGIAAIHLFSADYQKAESELTAALSRSRHEGRNAVTARLATLLGKTLALVSRYDDAEALLAEALELASTSGDLEAEAEAGSTLLMTYKLSGRSDNAEAVFERTMQIADRLGDEYKAVEALGHIGWMYMNAGESEKARSIFMAALPLTRARGDRMKEAYTLNSIAATYFGSVSEATTRTELEYYRGAMEIWEHLKYDRARVGGANNLGLVYSRQARFQDAKASYLTAVESAREWGERSYLSMFLGNLASAHLALGEYEAAEEAAREALAIAEEVEHLAHQAHAETALGVICQAVGRPDEAQRWLDGAVAHARSARSAWQEAHALVALGELLIETGQAARGREILHTVLSRAEKSGYEDLSVRAAAMIAYLDGLGGDRQAENQLRDLSELTQGLYPRYFCRRLLGRLLLETAHDQQSRERAHAVLSEAQQEASAAGYTYEVMQIERLLDRLQPRG